MAAFPMSGAIDHPALGRVRYQLTEVSDDPDTQVEQTIALMVHYAIEDSAHPLIKDEARMVAASNDPTEDVWRYLSRTEGARRMKFVHDETTGRPWDDIGDWRPVVETLMRPVDQVVAPVPQGDCDDFAMYGAAHLLARGVPCSYCTVAADPNEPGIYSHVYLVAYPHTGPHGGERVPMDLSHGHFAGWETENKYGKRREWQIVPVGPPVWPWVAVLLAGLLLVSGGVKW